MLGVSGKMGSGKTTVALLAAARLTNATGVKWQVTGFATALKRLVCATYQVPLCLAYTAAGKATVPYKIDPIISANILPVPLSDAKLKLINGQLRARAVYNQELGVLLQRVGNLFREVEPDYWVKALEAELTPNEPIVIEDVRFKNELAWIKANKGIVCRVFGPTDAVVLEARDPKHESETALDYFNGWDFVVCNKVHGADMSALHASLAKSLCI